MHTDTEQLNTVVYTSAYRHRITQHCCIYQCIQMQKIQHRCIYQCIQTQNNSTPLYIPVHTDTEQLNTVVYTSVYRHRITQHRCIYQCIQTQNNLTPLYLPVYTVTE